MISKLEDMLEAHAEGDFPLPLLISWVVKKLALEGTRSDFEGLPEWLKNAVISEIEQFEHGLAQGEKEGWYVIGANRSPEDYGPYAERVRREILGS